MALTNKTQFANRYGLNIEIFNLADDMNSAEPIMVIDFANVCDVDIGGDRVWATGGRAHTNRIAFNDPLQGTFTISTQILTTQILALLAGNNLPKDSDAVTEVVFQNTANSMPKYYQVKADTVWQDAEGETYAETLIFHKATPNRAFNISYSGEGDPTSVDVVFDALEDADGKVLTVKKIANEDPTGGEDNPTGGEDDPAGGEDTTGGEDNPTGEDDSTEV